MELDLYEKCQLSKVTKHRFFLVSGNVKEWLENSVHLSDSADSQIINNLLDSNPEFYDAENKDDFAKNYEILMLQKRIEEHKEYSKLNTILLAQYEEDLKNIL